MGLSDIYSKIKGFFTDDDGLDWSRILGTGVGAAGLVSLLRNDQVKQFLGLGGANTNQPVGYQGGIPTYTAQRTALPIADKNLQMSQVRDWAKQYCLDADAEAAQAQKVMDQGIGFEQLGQYAAQIGRPYTPKEAFPTRRPGSEGRRYFSDVTYAPVAAAQGGLMSLPSSQGYYLGGVTDGMADKIPARIDGKQEARLSDGEFVMPADVVSHLGNGNSEAGARVLYDMMDRVRRARTGTAKQGRQINPNKYTPV